MPLPIPPEAISQLPEGFPTVIEMSIEAWATETYASYGRQMLQGNPMMAALGLSELADIGFVLRQMNYPMAPLVLGIILGALLDKSLRRGLTLTDGDLTPFFTRPISALFVVIIVLSILAGLSPVRRAVGRLAAQAGLRARDGENG